jgi:hypothetical protein
MNTKNSTVKKQSLHIALVLVLLLLVLIASMFSSCQKNFPSGTPVAPAPGNFHNITVNGNCKLKLVSGSTNQLDSIIGGYVHNIVINGTLMLNGSGNVYITINDLDSVFANGNSSISCKDTLHLDYLAILCNGSSDVTLTVEASDSITALVNGSGKYNFSGSAPKLNVGANGHGTFSGFGLFSKNCDVGVNGSGTSEVSVSDTLRAYINGNGTVYYKGNPVVIPVHMNGNGKLIKK